MLLSPVTWPRCTRQSSPSSMWPVGIAWPGRMMMDQRLAASTVAQGTILPLDMSPAEQERLLADNMAMKPLSEGEVDHHWIDAYEVVCESQTTTVYMDL